MNDSVNIKLLLLGDPSVGKTTFLKKYIENKYLSNYELTIGVDYAFKKLILNNKNVNLQIWDTAGQESFRSITTSYFRSSHCALIFFDVCNIDSYNNIEYWVNTYLNSSNNDRNSILLIGNKSDSIMRDVSKKDCFDLANSLDLIYCEISLKTNTIDDINQIIINLLNNIDLNKHNEIRSVDITSRKNKYICGFNKCV